MGHSLKRMAYVHAQLAQWMQSHDVVSLHDTNIKTARRGLDWQWSFLASVLKSYGKTADKLGVKASFDDAAMSAIYDAFLRAKNDSSARQKET